GRTVTSTVPAGGSGAVTASSIAHREASPPVCWGSMLPRWQAVASAGTVTSTPRAGFRRRNVSPPGTSRGSSRWGVYNVLSPFCGVVVAGVPPTSPGRDPYLSPMDELETHPRLNHRVAIKATIGLL